MAKMRLQTNDSPLKHSAATPRKVKPSFQAVVRAHYDVYQRFDPTEVLVTLLSFKRIFVSVFDYRDMQESFYQPTEHDYECYGFPVLAAVRNGDIEKLESLRQEGQSLNCCNKVGESILHLACRIGQTNVVRYLVQEVGVPTRICDTYGRTPMHDAYWTSEPNLELVNILVAKSPDLLFIKDMRGHTPMNYAPKKFWKMWVKYFAKSINNAQTLVSNNSSNSTVKTGEST
ncbi:hypothetical protein ACA910_003745 [Epithemia clementina (nom. ined.)]